jgi:glycosyltransferase involved in cell wall biosynthesis
LFVIKLLCLASSLDYSGAARKIVTLAAGLPRDQFQVGVAVLGGDAPWVQTLREAGVTVNLLGWHRAIDLRPVLALRGLFHSFQPDVVHVWSRKALLSLAATIPQQGMHLLASNLLTPGHPLAIWERMLLRRRAIVVAFSAAEAQRYQRDGILHEQIAVIPPGWAAIDTPTSDDPSPVAVPGGRFILCIGPLEMHKGFRDAVWALDILHYLYNDLHLVLVGNGSDRLRIGQFAHSVGASERVHFLGPLTDLPPVLLRAAVVWIPSRIQGGVYAALEAMAAGRAVVGTCGTGLDEIVVDGVTGFLVKPGDKAGLARKTRLLLDDPSLAARLGDAGRRRVLDHFPAGQMVNACARLYSEADPARIHAVTT